MVKYLNLSVHPMLYGYIESTPIGMVGVGLTKLGVRALVICNSKEKLLTNLERIKLPLVYDAQKTSPILEQIDEYFNGKRKRFNLKVDWSGIAPFQERVLRVTMEIPYGETTTYREIARRIGNPLAFRAVGNIEATNPIPLIIPCHRVIASDGSLRGYSGGEGVVTKQWLLDLEKKVSSNQKP